VTTLADIFRQYGQKYLLKYGIHILPSHKKAMQDVTYCRTPDMGGQTWKCEHCGKIKYSYHSCRNRHCPKCQNDRTTQWLLKQIDLLLSVPYFMVTVTVPEELRAVFRTSQKKMYGLLFKVAAEAIITLARDKKYLGADIGLMVVLQTWARNLIFHPHIHFLIPGGGITADGKRWKWANPDFFVHYKPLAILIRAKFRDAVKKTEWYAQIPPVVWQKDWVCQIEQVGSGENVLRYLAPYIYRVAISNNNILSIANDEVTFRYKDGETDEITICTIEVMEFIRRFLQHVLPKGFVKVRYFGFLSTKKRSELDHVKELIGERLEKKKNKSYDFDKPEMKCPDCGHILILIGELPRRRGPP
jgi:hypothetical protein